MLSSRSISGTPGAAAKYYTVGDYYTKGADETSTWIGAGADRLQLSGDVSKDDLTTILKGDLPAGHEAAWKRYESEAKPHRPGRDFTFSAPKSVSVAALVGGDKRLIAAHEAAVDVASAYLETYAATRVRMRGGEIEYRLTENMVAAKFLEFASREEEAQLHTHLVVANMTFDAKSGKWRSMEYDGLETAKMAAGQVYRSALAKSAKKLGFQIESDPTTGFFAITGVPEKLIDDHSTRSKQIDEHLKGKEDQSSKARARAALATRKNKAKTTIKDLTRHWKDRAGPDLRALNAVLRAARSKVGRKNNRDGAERTSADHLNATLNRAMRFGLGHATSGEAVVDEAQIIRNALQVSVGETVLGDVRRRLDAMRQDKKLIAATEQTGGRRLYRGRTASKDLQAEERFANLLAATKGTLKPILRDQTAERRLGRFRIKIKDKGQGQRVPLSPEQFDAAKTILTTGDRVHHVLGVGGAGKSSMVRALKEAAPLRGHLAVAKTAVAASSLGKDAGVPWMTVDKFLARAGADLSFGGVLYVDEATMLGTRAAARIDALASKDHFRVVVIGDDKQLPAIEQGKPHAIAGRLGAAVSQLKTSRRHKTQSVKNAVAAARIGRIGRAMKHIDRINSRDSADLALGAAQAWAVSDDRANNRILSLDNKMRVAASDHVRNILKREGVVAEFGAKVEIFSAHPMTDAQKKIAAFYPTEDAGIVFTYGDKKLKLEKNARLRIVGRKGETLLLEREQRGRRGDKERMAWNPRKSSIRGVSVYDVQRREIAKGDVIQWKRNQKDKGNLKNGMEGVVVALKGAKATIAFDDGAARKLDLDENPHWDHAYALTVYKAQGATYRTPFVIAPARSGPLLNQQTFYTALSRAQQSISLWTDDRDKLTKVLLNAQGGKTSALEGVGRLRPAAVNGDARQEATAASGRRDQPLETTAAGPSDARPDLSRTPELDDAARKETRSTQEKAAQSRDGRNQARNGGREQAKAPVKEKKQTVRDQEEQDRKIAKAAEEQAKALEKETRDAPERDGGGMSR